MTDDLVRLPVIGRIVRRRWRVLAVWTVLGAIVGVIAALLFSPGYETSTRVLLQGPREENEILTEAQVAASSVVLDRTAAALGLAVSGRELTDSVTANVVNGSVIEISATADDPAQAQRLADTAAEEYVSFSTQLVSNSGDASAQLLQEQRAALRQQVETTNRRVSELHTSTAQGLTVESVQVRTELEALRGALAEAIKTLDETEAAAGRANMVVLGPAPLPTSPAPPTLLQFAGGGAVVFLLLAAFAHLFAARADRRLRDEPSIAAAVGAPVLGTLDVPGAPADSEASPPAAVRHRLRRLLWDDRPWDEERHPTRSGDEVDARYRRALAKLRTRKHLLVLVPVGDVVARRAANKLVAAGRKHTTLDIVEVAFDRPAIPDGRGGALVVVTTGTRTALDLAGLAVACADAGHEVAGALLTRPTDPVAERPAEEPTGSGRNTPVDALAGAP